ncbi:CHAT domain-containing protein [Agromyces mariniharenae]|uniref:CHAT domain-containing protein n=1 Tax=Agromyces mariniharenae TaxID=2604423 RepID=A0A5S4V2Z9_9MICO|nr:CHAT domain-containing protein [Agromyces mariniharenae]TYL53372.1 CHAT domain-containing protein [Agromyces mariniharenae]
MDTVMELEIGPGPEPDSYVVRVLRSVGGGEPTETITLDLDDLVNRRPHVEASVLASSVTARRVMSESETAIQDVGRRLFDSAFAGSVATAYRTSMAVASERGESVQIALSLTAPGLAALPWETLYDSETQRYLCRKEPLVRKVPAPYSTEPLTLTPPLRVLAMISSPRGLPTLDIDDERTRLESALKPHLETGRVELQWLEDASWEGIHAKLLERRWHVLHFIGHGAYDTDTDEGVLAFVGRDGRADYVTASALADLLDEAEPTPRLVVLNSCQSGASGTSDLFSGTAAALAHSGIRAVAAMQFSISDMAALAFARGFYTSLAYGRGIDEAVRSGRIGILGIGRGTLEWVTPVLYLRGEGARLFDVTAQFHRVPPPERPSPRRRENWQPVASAPVAAEPAMASVGRESPKRAPRRTWILVAIIAAVVIAGLVYLLNVLRPWESDGGGDSSAQPSTAVLAVGSEEQWVEVGLTCDQGDEFVITTSGTIYYDGTAESEVGPDGLTNGELPELRAYPDFNTASVIGKLSTLPEPFAVGSGTTYECTSQGDLMLGVNDADLSDNAGQFRAAIQANYE